MDGENKGKPIVKWMIWGFYLYFWVDTHFRNHDSIHIWLMIHVLWGGGEADQPHPISNNGIRNECPSLERLLYINPGSIHLANPEIMCAIGSINSHEISIL